MALTIHDLHYDLPPEQIAQEPLEPRDASRLLVADRATGSLQHRHFRELPELLLSPSCLVFNATRVRPARVFAQKPTGGEVEVLLLRDLGAGRWVIQCSRRKRLHPGNRLVFFDGLLGGTLVEMRAHGDDILLMDDDRLFRALLPGWGVMPLPPYIHATHRQPERYQTVYAEREGSAAAPTAGLHFTPTLLEALREAGHQLVTIDLEVGLGTFEPVRVEDLTQHPIHSERGQISESAAATIQAARSAGVPVIAVGTTSTRLLEHAARQPGGFGAFAGEVDTYILPGFEFQIVDHLITNFHLPGSTLLGLVAAFAGREQTLGWYRQAVAEGYRFFSFGDAMLIR